MNAANTLVMSAAGTPAMSAASTLAISAGLGSLLAALTMGLLWRSFGRLLADLTGSEAHGRFWLVFASVSIVLTTLFASLTSFPTGELATWNPDRGLAVVANTFRTGLLGLLLSLGLMALPLLVSIGQRVSGQTEGLRSDGESAIGRSPAPRPDPGLTGA